jgi:hypothetical protein
MRNMRSRVPWVVGLVSVVIGLIWHWGPFPCVFAVRQLSDPARLADLGERGANPRLNKIVYWLDQANHRGMAPKTTIRLALSLNFTPQPKAALVADSLLRNYGIAEDLGLFTLDNLAHLRRGQTATVTRGPYRGEGVEIDHIVPLSLAPELGNELANLEMLPRSLNRHKSNRVGERQLSHAQRLQQAGLLTTESMARLQTTRAR